MAYLLDTGILLRLVNTKDDQHLTVKAAIELLSSREELLYTTTQNVAELISVYTRPSEQNGLGKGSDSALHDLRQSIEPICGLLFESQNAFIFFKSLVARYAVHGKQIRDARLVAQMLAYRIDSVLTLDERDFLRYQLEGIRVITPTSLFASARQLFVIGLLGGIASGKSFVAHGLARRGAVVLDADKAGHEVLRESDVEAACRARWGEGIVGPDGHIHRLALGAIVFAPPPDGPRELAYLEGLTHPRLGDRLRKQLAELANVPGSTNQPVIAVLDAPVMLKAGWNEFCNLLIFVDAPREVRLARAKARGWSEAEFNRREAAQESLEIKQNLAREVINNAGDLAATEAQIDRIWTRITNQTL